MTTTAAAPLPSSFRFPRPTRFVESPPAPLARPRRRCYPWTLCCRPGEQLEAPPSSSSPSSLLAAAAARDGTCTDGSRTLGLHGRRRGLVWLSALLPLLLSPQYGAEFSLAAAAAQGIDADESFVVRTGVRKVLSKVKAAGVLRLAFHDAGTFDMIDNTGGMNGSIVLELDRPENAGLTKSVKILEKAKSELDKVQQVSWADLIAVAGAEAVSLCGGPVIPIRLGRVDARIPDPEGKLPEESLNASALKKCFLEKGFSTQELVVLSGAHTLGGKGFGNPNVFDNTYYKVLLEKPWMSSDSMSRMIGLPSDHALVDDEECLRWITAYAADQMKFFDDFRRAYVKLVDTGASWRKA